MCLRSAPEKKEPCVSLYNGPIVLPDGEVLACPCVAAMDAVSDLSIGNILQQSLQDIYTGDLMRQLRDQFSSGRVDMNKTCANCEMYRNLELYRTREGRVRAALNRNRHGGEVFKRGDKVNHIFQGG
jgi:radical SAM protein with 4Fe4S-binding SPASM domain